MAPTGAPPVEGSVDVVVPAVLVAGVLVAAVVVPAALVLGVLVAVDVVVLVPVVAVDVPVVVVDAAVALATGVDVAVDVPVLPAVVVLVADAIDVADAIGVEVAIEVADAIGVEDAILVAEAIGVSDAIGVAVDVDDSLVEVGLIVDVVVLAVEVAADGVSVPVVPWPCGAAKAVPSVNEATSAAAAAAVATFVVFFKKRIQSSPVICARRRAFTRTRPRCRPGAPTVFRGGCSGTQNEECSWRSGHLMSHFVCRLQSAARRSGLRSQALGVPMAILVPDHHRNLPVVHPRSATTTVRSL